MAKLTAYTAASRFDSDGILITDGSSGTRKITVSNAAPDIVGAVSDINHRNVYRGKNLGTSITSAQQAAISAGTFDDLFIGDYWTLNGTSYIIADMDYWYYTGDTIFNTHHLVMIPSKALYTAAMNEENTTEGGYVGSLMYTTNLEDAKTTIATDFGDLLLTHREYLSNAVTNGYPSAGAWYDSTVELMNEIMVYGSHIYAPMNNDSVTPFNGTIDKQQLALFQLSPRGVNIRGTCWLRDIANSTYFAYVGSYGEAFRSSASNARGVRPVFAIGIS